MDELRVTLLGCGSGSRRKMEVEEVATMDVGLLRRKLPESSLAIAPPATVVDRSS